MYRPLAQDPVDQLLLGPTYGIPKILDKAGLKMSDVDTWEIHEAFAVSIQLPFRTMLLTSYSTKVIEQKLFYMLVT